MYVWQHPHWHRHADATGTAVSAITYTNVGVAGSYDKVVTSTMAPTCVSNVCQKTPKTVSGPLVPSTKR